MEARFLFLLALTVPLSGCAERHIQELSRRSWSPQKAQWPELTELSTGQGGQNLTQALRLASRGPRGLSRAFNDPQFVERFQKFEAASIPPQFATPEREKAKADFVARIKKMQTVKDNANPAEVSQNAAWVYYLYNKIEYIPGQTAPVGAEAAKYSSVHPPVEPVPPTVPVVANQK